MNNLPLFFPTHVITHKYCQDGTTAYHMLRKLCQLFGKAAPELTALFPNEEIPEKFLTKNEFSVIMVDIAFSVNSMKRAADTCKDFIVLDHHLSSKEKLDGLTFTHFDMDKCGAKLASDYAKLLCDINGLEWAEPWYIRVVDARDRFVWTNETRALSEVLFQDKLISDEGFERMEKMSQKDIEDLTERGKMLYNQKVNSVKKYTPSFTKATYGPFSVLFSTTIHKSNVSDVGEYMYTNNDEKIIAMAAYDITADEWWISTRSRTDVNLVDVFRQENRPFVTSKGGHPNAYGITVKGVANIRELFRVTEP